MYLCVLSPGLCPTAHHVREGKEECRPGGCHRILYHMDGRYRRSMCIFFLSSSTASTDHPIENLWNRRGESRRRCLTGKLSMKRRFMAGSNAFLRKAPPSTASFIKTTYDISLDSQISLLPLGFSLLGVPWAIVDQRSERQLSPRRTTQDRENPPPLVETGGEEPRRKKIKCLGSVTAVSNQRWER